MILYTVQIPKRRHCLTYGAEFVDTTVKSGLKAFAPTWDMVLGHKNQSVSDAEYIRKFHKLMQESVTKEKETWLEIANKGTVALGCYCPVKCFCHRLLLVYYFQVFCTRHKIPFKYLGEISHDGNESVVFMPPLPFKTL